MSGNSNADCSSRAGSLNDTVKVVLSLWRCSEYEAEPLSRQAHFRLVTFHNSSSTCIVDIGVFSLADEIFKAERW